MGDTLKLLSIALASLFAFSAIAHEDSMGIIKGEKFSIHYSQHAFAGQVNGHLVYATPLEGDFGVKLTSRIEGKEFQTTFKEDDNGVINAKLSTITKAGGAKETTFSITKIEAKQFQIIGQLDNDLFIVNVTSDKLVGGHHLANPVFNVRLGEKAFTFQLENGEACIMCSTKISFVVLTMLRATGAI
jgi:hypothetical protein